MKTITNSLKNKTKKGVTIILFAGVSLIFNFQNSQATTFTVNVNDGGWGNPATVGTLAKAIADFNAAPTGSHIINVTIPISLNDPAKWAISNATSNLTINGNGNTVDGPGYNSWTLNVNQLAINDWTMTAGFGTATTTLAGAGGHTFTNSSIANVAFIFTKNNNVLTNSTFSGPGGTYAMAFNSNNTNTITGCLFDQMALKFTTSITNAISNTVFTKSGVSFLSASNNNTIYGCKFNTNLAGTALVASGIAFDITVNASTGNIIGANSVAQRNIFALSSTNSISVVAGSTNTSIVGNYFGTDVNGTTSLSGAGTNSTISLNASQNVTIDANVLASMQGSTGGAIEIVAGNCSGLIISNNKIGVDVNGTGAASFGNGDDGIVFTAGTVNNLSVTGNTIARSVNIGINIKSLTANPMSIQNNNIGSNATGLYDGTDYGNGHGGIVFTAGTMSNITVSGNVLVRNGWVTQDNNSCGIYVVASVTTISISNNKIGVYSNNASSAPAGQFSGNSFAGIYFQSTSSAITISNNVIGRNGFGTTKSHGIATSGGISNITISNNYIGVTPASVAIGNGNSGIDLQNVNTGTVSGNYISGNEGRRTDIPAAGLALSNGSTLISVTSNFFGIAPNGTAMGQQLNGSSDGSAVRAEGTASKIILNNNTLAYSAGNGVNVVAGADFVQIFDNSIYCNTAKGINLNCGGAFPNTPGNSSFGCGTITLNAFTPPVSVVNGGRPTNSVVYVYGTNACAATCGANPQGQARFTAATTTYPTGSTWDYNNGSTMLNDITALAVGLTATANCSGIYCRTSEFSTCVNNTLPVHLLYFTATAQQNRTVLVSWATATEEKNAYFIIERSKDGKNFEPIGSIDGNGNSQQKISYEYTDLYPEAGTSYYRLRQVDYDGTAAYSEIKAVSFISAASISIYPNPNNGNFKVSFVSDGTTEITISDILGQTVYTALLEGKSLDGKDIQTSLAKGTYFLHVNSSDVHQVSKFVVE
jgi:hypothetical protein